VGLLENFTRKSIFTIPKDFTLTHHPISLFIKKTDHQVTQNGLLIMISHKLKPDKPEVTALFNQIIFIVGIWLFSRAIIFVGMKLIGPWFVSITDAHVENYLTRYDRDILSPWDGGYYQRIATFGYLSADNSENSQTYSFPYVVDVAFFPFYPLLTRLVMNFGLSFPIAGALVNNFSFLGALFILYRWVEEKYSTQAAKWTIAVMTLCPLSVFGTITYTEGLFLLLTTASLHSFEHKKHIRAALWGAMATATRVTGSALIPAFLLVSWRERRPISAYIACFAISLGLLSYMFYLFMRFGDPLAFIHVQKVWAAVKGSHLMGWWKLFTQDLMLKNGLSQAYFAFIKVIMFFGGSYILWQARTKLTRTASAYGFCSIALILVSGGILSVDRFVYVIIPIPIALSLLLSRHHRWGYTTLGVFSLLLLYYSMRLSYGRWVG
jgi:Gpi18-like mannosyltransferase